MINTYSTFCSVHIPLLDRGLSRFGALMSWLLTIRETPLVFAVRKELGFCILDEDLIVATNSFDLVPKLDRHTVGRLSIGSQEREDCETGLGLASQTGGGDSCKEAHFRSV